GLLLRRFAADRNDLEDRQALAMADAAAIIVPAALLEHNTLFAARLRHDLGRDGEALGILDLGAVAREQHIAEHDGIAGFASQLPNDDLVSGGDAILLPARALDCEHAPYSFRSSIAGRRRLVAALAAST